MARFTCQICSKSFSNGKAVGGHMRTHLAFHPLPPKPHGPQEFEDLNKASPSMPLRFVTGKRSRQCKSMDAMVDIPEEVKTPGLVSVTSPIEDVALSIMMLAKGKWKDDKEEKEKEKGKQKMEEDIIISENESKEGDDDNDEDEDDDYVFYPKRTWTGIHTQMVTRAKAREVTCGEGHPSDQMLENHKAEPNEIDTRLYACEFCPKVFKSRQALGGHMKIHASSSSDSVKPKLNLINLNRPPPEEDDEIN
ncbi:hypothetical protein Acr_24g0013740 [Actinidia rufa]|uniref:C2H2-type domain-containing protein n=1 Tax=Actinidia rufa TaxID=165716 RepID=A0A7J0GXA0_9ERIC|nr:hypothetical protein Acr_24g0013740 [Actinidia rufa]